MEQTHEQLLAKVKFQIHEEELKAKRAKDLNFELGKDIYSEYFTIMLSVYLASREKGQAPGEPAEAEGFALQTQVV